MELPPLSEADDDAPGGGAGGGAGGGVDPSLHPAATGFERLINEALQKTPDRAIAVLRHYARRLPPAASNRRARFRGWLRGGPRNAPDRDDDDGGGGGGGDDDGGGDTLMSTETVAERSVRKARKRLTKVRRPPSAADKQRVMRLATEIVPLLGLLDTDSPRARIQLFFGYCLDRNYTYNTTCAYFRKLRIAGLFGPEDGLDVNTLTPDRRAFATSGRQHTRVISVAEYATLHRALMASVDPTDAPLRVAACTGLRTNEVLQMSLATLQQLSAAQPLVNVRRKNVPAARYLNDTTPPPPAQPNYWRPQYTSLLASTVAWLRDDLYASEYRTYLRTGVDMRLFAVKDRTIANRIRAAFYRVLHRRAPHGFGVHSNRNMLAITMAKGSNGRIGPIQDLLQHRSPKTTKGYIQADFTELASDFDRFTGTAFAQLRDLLSSAATTAAAPPPPEPTPPAAEPISLVSWARLEDTAAADGPGEINFAGATTAATPPVVEYAPRG